MENPVLTSQSTIGKKINLDVFSNSGVLLVAVSTVITRDHMRLLEKHGIVLTSRDVSLTEPKDDQYQHRMIDEAVLQVSQIFEEVRETKKLPLADLRKHVIPMIHKAVYGMHLLSLLNSLQAKDDYTYRHNIAVGAIASLLGNWMGLNHQELLQLTTSALLHDVGKMLIPNEVLNKPDKLTGKEYELMKNHTILGYEILIETVGINHREALVALQHHERMDGTGYPVGLTQEKIELFSRIVSVADIFHAMTSKRVYRCPLPFYEVLYQMEKDRFGVLDPLITKLFIEKIMNYLIGHSVLLTDGSEGIIRMVQMHDPTHPLIQIGDQFKDLSKDQSLHIKQVL